MVFKTKRMIVVLLAVLFSYSFTKTFIPTHNKGLGYVGFIYVYLFVIGLILYGFFMRKSLVLLAGNPFPKKIFTVVLVLLFSFGILKLIVPEEYLEPIKYSEIILTPVSLNNDINKNEIWLNGIIVDKVGFNIQQVEPSEGWIFKDGMLVFSGTIPKSQTINLHYKNEIQLIFGKHEWSGKVEINSGFSTRIIDLNTKNASQEIFVINKTGSSQINLRGLSLDIVFISLSSMILLVIFSALKAKFLKL